MEVVAFRVIGRVQGVGFRFFTCNLAREHNIRGTVKNMPDGSVLIQAAADPAAMALFRVGLHKGPAFSRVDDLQETKLPESTATWTDFQAKY